jgi:hypothetical protein
MGLFLRAEIETEVYGDGDGFIRISQTNDKGEDVEVWLSVNQFQIIFNQENHLVNEAFGVEKEPEAE